MSAGGGVCEGNSRVGHRAATSTARRSSKTKLIADNLQLGQRLEAQLKVKREALAGLERQASDLFERERLAEELGALEEAITMASLLQARMLAAALEDDPRFLDRITQARESLRAGRGVRIEDLPAG